MFLFKKIVAPLLYPLPLCFLILLIGVALLWFGRWQRAGKLLVTLSLALFAVFGYGVVSYPLVHSLEQTYPLPKPETLAQAKWVVVLSADTLRDPALPLTARAAGTTLTRLVEGIHLHREIAGSRLLLSGAATGPESDTEVMSQIALRFGVAAKDIVIDGRSPDTETQAVNVAAILKGEPCVLVTSAFHLPRAMALFEKAGVRAIAAPAQYLTDARRPLAPTDFYPATFPLVAMQIATNEYLGMAWARLRGRM